MRIVFTSPTTACSGAKGGYRVHGTVSVSSSSNGSWWGKGS